MRAHRLTRGNTLPLRFKFDKWQVKNYSNLTSGKSKISVLKMVHSCCVRDCKNRSNKQTGDNVSYHGFPTSPNSKKKWMFATKRYDAEVRSYLKVCSLHFQEEDFKIISGKRLLHREAIPSVLLGNTVHEANILTPSTNSFEVNNNENEEQCSVVKDVLWKYQILQKELEELKRQNEEMKTQWENDRYKFSQSPSSFCIEKFINNDKKILYYTGIQSYTIFNVIFDFIFPKGSSLDDLKIYNQLSKKRRRHSFKLTPENQFFLCLMRIRRGLHYEILGDMFGVATSSVNKICKAWTNLMYIRLGQLNVWPHRNILLQHTPVGYCEQYDKVIGSIDCTELYIQTPSSLLRQSQCFSHYKGCTTLKALIMTAPNGAILFISQLFTGAISDKQILEKSGFLKILQEKVEIGEIEEGDIILADKGFNVRDLFQNINIELNIPTFRITGIQFSPSEVEHIRYVAHERIHVERTIGRLKNFKILSNEIPIASLGTFEQTYLVCCMLCNFRDPIRQLTDSYVDDDDV